MTSKGAFLLVLLNLLKYVFDKEINIVASLKQATREKQAITILNNAIIARQKLNNTLALELMNTRKWLEASRMIIDFLIDFKGKEEIEVIKKNNENYLGYLANLKNSIKNKKKNIVKVSPVFEWSQDNKFVKIRVKFAKNLEAPGEIDIQDFFINCTRTNFFINGYKVHDDYLVWYYRQIDLQANIKSEMTDGYKETEGTYIIRLQKETETLYWSHLDQQHQSHHNMFTWFEVFTNYENKAGFTKWRDTTGDNLLESDIEDYKRGKREHQIKRQKRFNKNLEALNIGYAKNKNFCQTPVGGNKCYLTTASDWSFWQV